MAGDIPELRCAVLTAGLQQTSPPWLLGQNMAAGDGPARCGGGWRGALQLARAYNVDPQLGGDVGEMG